MAQSSHWEFNEGTYDTVGHIVTSGSPDPGASKVLYPNDPKAGQCAAKKPAIQSFSIPLANPTGYPSLTDFPIQNRIGARQIRILGVDGGYAGEVWFSFEKLGIKMSASDLTAAKGSLAGIFPLFTTSISGGLKIFRKWEFCSPMPNEIYITTFDAANGVLNGSFLLSNDVSESDWDYA